MFAMDVVGCFCQGSVKAVDQEVYFVVLIFKGANFPPTVAGKKIFDVEFLQTEPDPYVALDFHPLEAESEGHHYKLMVTSNISSWKAPGFCNVHA